MELKIELAASPGLARGLRPLAPGCTKRILLICASGCCCVVVVVCEKEMERWRNEQFKQQTALNLEDV
jgi:hypothetical protein